MLFRRYYAELCSFAAGFVGSFDQAREVVQDVLLKIWERRDRWRVHATLDAYLYQAVRNQALNHIRQEKRRRAAPLDLDLSALTTRRTPEDAASVREVLQKVQAAIDRLPERQRTAFTLHRRHGLTYSEIAEVMDISPRTVEVHISKASRGRRALRVSSPRTQLFWLRLRVGLIGEVRSKLPSCNAPALPARVNIV